MAWHGPSAGRSTQGRIREGAMTIRPLHHLQGEQPRAPCSATGHSAHPHFSHATAHASGHRARASPELRHCSNVLHRGIVRPVAIKHQPLQAPHARQRCCDSRVQAAWHVVQQWGEPLRHQGTAGSAGEDTAGCTLCAVVQLASAHLNARQQPARSSDTKDGQPSARSASRLPRRKRQPRRLRLSRRHSGGGAMSTGVGGRPAPPPLLAPCAVTSCPSPPPGNPAGCRTAAKAASCSVLPLAARRRSARQARSAAASPPLDS